MNYLKTIRSNRIPRYDIGGTTPLLNSFGYNFGNKSKLKVNPLGQNGSGYNNLGDNSTTEATPNTGGNFDAALSGGLNIAALIGTPIINKFDKSNSIDALGNPIQTESKWGIAGKDAIQDAAIGASVAGPIGAGVAGLAGGIYGYLSNNSEEQVAKQKEQAKIKANEMSTTEAKQRGSQYSNTGNTYSTMFKRGGYLKKMPEGGPVKPYIAKDQEDFKNRTKAYNDSNTLYKNYLSDVMMYHKSNWPGGFKEHGNLLDEEEVSRGVNSFKLAFDSDKIKPIAGRAFLTEDANKKDVEYPFWESKTNIVPIRHKNKGELDIIPVYKKPEQQILPPNKIQPLIKKNISDVQKLQEKTRISQPEIEAKLNPDKNLTYYSKLNAYLSPEIIKEMEEESPRYTSDKIFIQGRDNMRKYGVNPGWYHPEELKPKYAKGGNLNPEYEVEDQEIIQGNDTNLEGQEDLASDMTKAVGATHEQGGILGEGGERVFSDRIKIWPQLYSILKANKISVKPNDTYAKVAEVLGKKKGKFEDKLESFEPTVYKTGQTMTKRMDNLIEATFQEQETNKNQDMESNEYKEGGWIQKAINPAHKGYCTPMSKATCTPHRKALAMRFKHGDLHKKAQGGDLEDDDPTNPLRLIPQDNSFDPSAWSGYTNMNTISPRGLTTPNLEIPQQNFAPVANDKFLSYGKKPSMIGSTLKKAGNSVLNFASENPEQIANAVIYFNNLNNIDKQQTNIKRYTPNPVYTKAPNYLNQDLSSIEGSINTLNKSIDTHSSNPQDVYARKADIFSRGIKGKNEAVKNQSMIDFENSNRNTSITNQYNLLKAENSNQDEIDKAISKNKILANKQEASNAFLQGVMGNIANKRSYKVDRAKVQLQSLLDGNRGVDERLRNKILTNPDKYKDLIGTLDYKKKGGYLKGRMKSYC